MTKQTDTLLAGDSTPATTVCNQCKTEATPFLHYIKHRGIFRRLCTTCILRFNSQLFCPICFSLYNPTSALQDSTTPCSKCHSISHTSCIGPNPSGHSGGYVCCLCDSSSIFGSKSGSSNVFDKRSAAALLAAAKISYECMMKAKSVARGEMEKRSKEAWATKKRAREAMENVVGVEEKVGSEGFGRVLGNVGERNVFGVDRVDNSSAVLASLNAVELNDKGNVVGGGGLGANVENGGGFGRQIVPVVDEKPIASLGPYVQSSNPRDGNCGSFP
ncbi:hypothetical protein POM88_024062 [Heracleum sosnowskyi]|uniref:Uncharacterized protein n=1 Tax=Heracleum sosnowskyi TaxID=360622 RepID=A0AAD8MVJ0_9APIA|nr:hypothetical protein POM88_024062 [Heracleum sosnowskyi]